MTAHALIYVDDSGNETVGVLLSALVLPAQRWATTLGYWKDLRSELEQRHGLPTSFEIHSVTFLSGDPLKEERKARQRRVKMFAARSEDPVLDAVALTRAQVELSDEGLNRAITAALDAGRPLADISAAARIPEQDVSDRAHRGRSLGHWSSVGALGTTGGRVRREIYARLLDQINAFPDARVLTVYTPGSAGSDRRGLYAFLLETLNRWLTENGMWGTVFVDGTPSARTPFTEMRTGRWSSPTGGSWRTRCCAPPTRAISCRWPTCVPTARSRL